MTNRPIVPDTRLDILKEEAKALLKSAKAREPDAVQRIAEYFTFTKDESPKLTQMHLVIAREFGFASWNKLKKQIELREELVVAKATVEQIAERMKLGKKKMRVAPKEGKDVFYCSFCAKSQYEVAKLIAGPSAYICDECVDLCVKIRNEKNPTAT